MRDGLVFKDSLRNDKKDWSDMEGIIHCMSRLGSASWQDRPSPESDLDSDLDKPLSIQ